VLVTQKFKDAMWVLTKPIGWKPNPTEQSTRLRPLTLPKGFVTDFASIPRVFWSVLPRDGDYVYAAVIHDYLYWIQSTSREEADAAAALADFSISTVTAATIYNAIHLAGERAW